MIKISPRPPFFKGVGGIRKLFSNEPEKTKGGDETALNEGSKQGIMFFLFTQYFAGGEK